MAINLAEKFSPKVDERFSLASVTDIGFNRDYDWAGVKTVNVYSIATSALNNYTRSGANRYGTPAELDDTKQELTLTQDKGFTFTLDRGNNIDQMETKDAGRALRRQIDEVVIPTVDTYRIATLAAAATPIITAATAGNAYNLFLAGQTALGDAKVPAIGRVAYVSYAYYAFLKQDSSFIKQGDLSQEMLRAGVLGMLDGVYIIPVPASYLPTNTQFILVHPSVAVAPVKLAEYHMHLDPPGISGTLIEGRLYYDAFVLESKIGGIYVSNAA